MTTHAAIDRLSTIGRPEDETICQPDAWTSPEELGLTAADIPHLARLAKSAPPELPEDMDEEEIEASTEQYASVHAWRALSQFEDPRVLPALLDALDELSAMGDDWAIEEIPVSIIARGPEVLPEVTRYLPDQRRDPFARGAMGNALPALVDAYPETRPAVVKALSAALALAKFNDPATNALFIAALVELRATETLPTIKKAYEIEAVEEELIGDYSVIEEEMALPVGEHSERRPQHEHDDDCGCGHEH